MDLRCAPLGPGLESHFEWKVIRGLSFVLDSPAALRASQPAFREFHSKQRVVSNGTAQWICAARLSAPVWKVISSGRLSGVRVSSWFSQLRYVPRSPRFVNFIPNSESFRMQCICVRVASLVPVWEVISSGRLFGVRVSSWIPKLRYAPRSPSFVNFIPTSESFRMALHSGSALRASRPQFGNSFRVKVIRGPSFVLDYGTAQWIRVARPWAPFGRARSYRARVACCGGGLWPFTAIS